MIGSSGDVQGAGVKMRIEVTCMVPMRKFSQATESEGEAFWTVRTRRVSFRNVPRTTKPGVKNFRRVPFFGSPFLGTQER